MGVPRLFPWLRATFAQYITHFQQGEREWPVDYLYLDANGLLHNAAQYVFSYGSGSSYLNPYENLSYEEKCEKVYELFMDRVMYTTRIMIPGTLLYIAIDGPAPLAKQSQQRQRRFVSALARIESEVEQFDSSSITPGTIFMHNLVRYMNYRIRYEMHKGELKPFVKSGLKVIFSPPRVAGEGEHKIMDYMRTLPREERMNKTHCMFGPDGDLIMLTLSSHIPNMFLFREDQYHTGYYDLVDIGSIRRQLPSVLGLFRTEDEAIDDFIVEGFLVGNDFLPKIQMFHMLEDGLELMIQTYKESSQSGKNNTLTRDGKFNLTGFTKFIGSLVRYEDRFLVEQVTTDDPKKQPPEAKFENRTLLDSIRVTSRGKVLDMEMYKRDYYKKSNIDIDTDEGKRELNNVCKDYLKTLIWVYEYYVYGLNSWSWIYQHHYAPLMTDLYSYLKNISAKDKEFVFDFTIGESSPPFVQLLSVLSPYSNRLVPTFLRPLMTQKSSTLVQKGIYPKKFRVDYEGKLHDYQGVALLPFVNYRDVYEAYESLMDEQDREKYQRNEPGKVYIFEYTPSKFIDYVSSHGTIRGIKVQKRIL